jgi:hypothetical protein
MWDVDNIVKLTTINLPSFQIVYSFFVCRIVGIRSVHHSVSDLLVGAPYFATVTLSHFLRTVYLLEPGGYYMY